MSRVLAASRGSLATEVGRRDEAMGAESSAIAWQGS